MERLAVRKKRPDFYSEASRLLSVMANPARIHMLQILSSREVSAGTLGEQIGLSQSATSQHLAKLRQAGLVSTRRDAQSIFYQSTSEEVRKVLDTLNDIVADATTTETRAA